MQNEVACDYNAGFVGALAKMYDVYGGEPIPGFTAVEEVPYPEIFVSASLSDRKTATEVTAFAVNKSGWPARVIDDLSFRYYIDLTDYINGGYSPDQISSRIIYSAASTATISGPFEYDTSKNIYYFEIDLSGTAIFPGSRSDHQKEVQFHIIPPNGAPWNSTKDYSYPGITEKWEPVPQIPVYSGGVLIYGEEPDGTTPKPTTSPSPEPTPTPPVKVTYGDINGDGEVNSMDAMLLSRHILEVLPSLPQTDVYGNPYNGHMAADLNGDGIINTMDSSLLQRYILEIISSFPVENR